MLNLRSQNRSVKLDLTKRDTFLYSRKRYESSFRHRRICSWPKGGGGRGGGALPGSPHGDDGCADVGGREGVREPLQGCTIGSRK